MEAMWPASYARFGWPRNTKTYPGEGYQGRWFHCTMGTENLIARQQHIAFTHPYTDPSVRTAGFVVPNAAAATFPVDAANKVVGLIAHSATAHWFQNKKTKLFNPSNVVEYATEDFLFAALASKVCRSHLCRMCSVACYGLPKLERKHPEPSDPSCPLGSPQSLHWTLNAHHALISLAHQHQYSHQRLPVAKPFASSLCLCQGLKTSEEQEWKWAVSCAKFLETSPAMKTLSMISVSL